MIDFGLLLLGQQEDEEDERATALTLAPWATEAAPSGQRFVRGETASGGDASASARLAAAEMLRGRALQVQRAAVAVQGVAACLLAAAPTSSQGLGDFAVAQGGGALAAPLLAAAQERARQVSLIPSIGAAKEQAATRLVAAPPAVDGLVSVAELDRAMERDARRYDKGFTLY